MKKVKVILVLFVLISIVLSQLKKESAHSIELDPEKLITMPMMMFGGKGTIILKDSVSNYELYFQGVEISSNIFSQIEKIEEDGNKNLDILKETYKNLKTEVDNLKTIFDKATDAYETGITNNVSEAELEKLKTEYETARNNYKAKVTEYNNKVTEYNNKIDEVNNKIRDLTPTYVENNWIQTTDDKISMDLTKISGEKPYVIWVKLVTASGTYYDEAIYTVTGTNVSDVNVTSVTLDKTSLSINEGSSYTLTATINPSDATNKSLKWKSDNEKIATVSNGKVMGVSEGTTTITVTTDDGNHIATCKVTVTKNPTSNNSGKDTEGEKKTTKDEDKTVANGKLPKTGMNIRITIISIIFILLFSIIMYKKYNIYKDI